jgi:hypothetical protein
VEIVTGDQWTSVETHFDALSGLSPSERAAGLASIEDEDVRREVASLLEHTEEDATIIEVVKAMAVTAEKLGYRKNRRSSGE